MTPSRCAGRGLAKEASASCERQVALFDGCHAARGMSVKSINRQDCPQDCYGFFVKHKTRFAVATRSASTASRERLVFHLQCQPPRRPTGFSPASNGVGRNDALEDAPYSGNGKPSLSHLVDERFETVVHSIGRARVDEAHHCKHRGPGPQEGNYFRRVNQRSREGISLN
jgi:hypothetical protein